ncbi:hypothetical protein [Sphingomonas bacterium]|uniref:hypothetical protein n=1 Tax=Sphingomonas bacterium TaxID=1895847 RepID=UPI00157525AE|nr:hypothetical protein [Sphingomonas bacterium]
MDDRVRISIEVDRADHEALNAIASDRAQSIDDLAAEALRARIDLETDFDQAMQDALSDIEAGRVISHEEYLTRAAERRRRWLAARSA